LNLIVTCLPPFSFGMEIIVLPELQAFKNILIFFLDMQRSHALH